ncbi:MAG: membrane protein insertion efficiency factor YidD [Candidatus Eisenbacteria sp.]|nr:membrane protein insertion efficiency factor YidD [Candidatus Eisenbacteria bacterium]
MASAPRCSIAVRVRFLYAPFLLFILFFPSSVTAFVIGTGSGSTWGWEVACGPKADRVEELLEADLQEATRKSSLASVYLLYKSRVSQIQGQQCGCLPSCSAYSLLAIHKYGALVGLLMTVERMYLRENEDIRRRKHYFPIVGSKGEVRAYDPPEANYVLGTCDWRVIDPALDFVRRRCLRDAD